jgi:septal ring factor EnvC (AmiA/AmiB activator)
LNSSSKSWTKGIEVPPRTNTELIRELTVTAAILTDRLDRVREDIKRLDSTRSETAGALTKLETRLTLVEERFADLRKTLEERTGRRWALLLTVLGVIGGLLGSIVPGLVKATLSYLRG